MAGGRLMSEFKFFEYSPNFRVMMILKALENGTTTHGEIASLAGIVPSLVNKYLKKLKSEGLVDNPNGRYQITEKGKISLSYLYLSYLSEIVDLYGSIENKFQDIFLKLIGKRELCIFGAGMVGRMLERLITTRSNFHIVAFLDEDEKKIGTKIDGIPVISLEDKFQADAIIVASFKNSEEMVRKLLERGVRSVYQLEFMGDRLKLTWRG